ncbi:MAG: MCE family protein [Nautilia sp.]|nr:MAG: MCE family protein [Nautilia sp.]
MRTETKIGLFVFLGLLSLFILSMQVNSFSNFGKKGYTIYAYINDATGLDKNAKVKLKGVDIGYLEDKKLDNMEVKLKLFIIKGVKIPEGSTISLTQDSMLGSKYIELIPSNSNQFLKPNDVIKNYKKIASFNEAVDSINAAAQEFRNFMHKLNKGVDEDAVKNFQQTLANLREGTEYFKKILAENRNNLKDTISGAKKMMATINERLPKIMKQIDELSAEFKQTGKTINAKLPKIMAQLDDLTAEFKQTGKDINKKLPTLLNKFEHIEDNVTTILVENRASLKSAIKSADTFFTSGGSAFDKLDDYFTSLTQSELDVEISTYQMFKDNYAQTRALIAYRPKPDKYYILGITSTKNYENKEYFNQNKHIKDKNYITAELGKRYDNVLLRGGLIDSTGGIGIDYFMYNDKLRLSAEVYDFNAVNDIRGNNAHARIEATYAIFHHINLYAGYDNFLNKETANLFLGLGVAFSDNDLKTLLSAGSSSFLK